jgi:hypothetical protein
VCNLDEALVSHSLWIDYYQWWGRSCFPGSQWSSNSLGLQFLLDVSVLINNELKISILILQFSNASDNAHGPILTTAIASNPTNFTIENCIGTCIQKNFTVAGTESAGM